MRYPNILHHGAVSGVTGSCRQLVMDVEHSLPVDCGLFQGAETSPEVRADTNPLVIVPLGTRRQRLETVLEHALGNQGTVMIPAFSIGRMQELLYELEGIIHRRAQKTPRSMGEAPGQPASSTTGGESNAVLVKAETAVSRLDWSNLPIIPSQPLYPDLPGTGSILGCRSPRAPKERTKPSGISQPADR